jgi:hypothetical protein
MQQRCDNVGSQFVGINGRDEWKASQLLHQYHHYPPVIAKVLNHIPNASSFHATVG